MRQGRQVAWVIHTPHPSDPATQVKPIEEAFKFSHFFSPFLTESDFDAKPSILLLGQYSTGKVWDEGLWRGQGAFHFLQGRPHTCLHCPLPSPLL